MKLVSADTILLLGEQYDLQTTSVPRSPLFVFCHSADDDRCTRSSDTASCWIPFNQTHIQSLSALLHGTPAPTSVDPPLNYTDVILTSEVRTAAKFVLPTATNLTNTPVVGTRLNGYKRLVQKYEANSSLMPSAAWSAVTERSSSKRNSHRG